MAKITKMAMMKEKLMEELCITLGKISSLADVEAASISAAMREAVEAKDSQKVAKEQEETVLLRYEAERAEYQARIAKAHEDSARFADLAAKRRKEQYEARRAEREELQRRNPLPASATCTNFRPPKKPGTWRVTPPKTETQVRMEEMNRQSVGNTVKGLDAIDRTQLPSGTTVVAATKQA